MQLLFTSEFLPLQRQLTWFCCALTHNCWWRTTMLVWGCSGFRSNTKSWWIMPWPITGQSIVVLEMLWMPSLRNCFSRSLWCLLTNSNWVHIKIKLVSKDAEMMNPSRCQLNHLMFINRPGKVEEGHQNCPIWKWYPVMRMKHEMNLSFEICLNHEFLWRTWNFVWHGRRTSSRFCCLFSLFSKEM